MDIDLEKIPLEKSLELELDGWNPLEINYTNKAFSGISWLFWKVAGTSHVFQIQYQTIIQKHLGNLEEHFALVLKIFREDYKNWESQGFPEDWMKNYRRMFQDLIV